MSARIYHNPACSKSRATLTLLREHGIEPNVVAYLEQVPASEVLHDLANKLGDAHALLRTNEAAYAESGLHERSTPAEIIAAIQRAPILLQRPIVVLADRAVIGRPPENVLKLLQ